MKLFKRDKGFIIYRLDENFVYYNKAFKNVC